MSKLFNRANPQTAKKTLAIFLREIGKDKKAFLAYALIIPINRLLYIVLLPLLFSLIIQSLILHPHDWHYPAQLLGVATALSGLALLTAFIGFKRLFVFEEKM